MAWNGGGGGGTDCSFGIHLLLTTSLTWWSFYYRVGASIEILNEQEWWKEKNNLFVSHSMMLMALVVMMTLPQHFSFTSRRRMKRVKTIQAARKDSRIKNEKSIYLSSSFHKFLLAEKCGVEKQDFSASSCDEQRVWDGKAFKISEHNFLGGDQSDERSLSDSEEHICIYVRKRFQWYDPGLSLSLVVL
jgi:hypothetical protein